MKRKLSIALLITTIVSMVPVGAVAENILSTAETIAEDIRVPILNAKNYQDKSLIDYYIRDESLVWETDITLSAGPLFKLGASHNSSYILRNGFNELKKGLDNNGDYYRVASGEPWSVDFKMKTPSEEFNKLEKTGQLKMKIGADIEGYGGSRPSITFKEQGILGKDLADNAKNRKESNWIELSEGDMRNNSIIISGEKAGSKAKVSNSYVLFADITSPQIKSARISGTTIYLDMGEPLRQIGDLRDMELVLSAANLTSGVENITLKATCIGVSENELAFSIEDTSDVQEYRITKINSLKCKNSEYKGYLYGISLGDEVRRNNYDYEKIDNKIGRILQKRNLGNGPYEKFTSTTPVTDIAGNPVEINRVYLDAYSLIVDNQGPVVSQVLMSGSMITTDSTIDSLPDSWPEDIDRSSVFSGVSDTLTFSLITNEKVVKSDNDSAYIELNINDESGQPIQLNLEKVEDYSDGVNTRAATKLTFEPVIINENMKAKNKDISIRPTHISVNGITDIQGNSFLSQNIKVSPKQQIYLDNIAPSVSIGDLINSGDVDFCIPITFNDGDGIVSGFEGLKSKFAWINNGDNQYPYMYAVTNSSVTPEESEFKYSTLSIKGNPFWNEFELPKSDRFIHLKVNENQLKDTTLLISTNDWAGNVKTESFSIDEINIDSVAPVLSLTSMQTEYSEESAIFTAQVKVDDFNIENLNANYQWVDKDEEAVQDAWNACNVENGLVTIKNEVKSDTVIEKDLLIFVTDVKSNKSEIARYSAKADLTKVETKYTIESDISVPNSFPKIIVEGPENLELKDKAQTRITLNMGDKYYVRVVSEKEKISVFDFNGDWYEVKYNQENTEFSDVLKVTDINTLKNYYGDVIIGFESAFADLTPIANTSIVPQSQDGIASYQEQGGFTVLYAPILDGLYTINFDKFVDENGDEIEIKNFNSEQYIKLLKKNNGVKINFTLKNLQKPEWVFSNLDFDKSYILLKDSKGKEVSKVELSRNETQTFYMPTHDMNGELLETEQYKLKIYLYQNGNDTPNILNYETAVVLDASVPSSNTGVTSYSIVPSNDGFRGTGAGIPSIDKTVNDNDGKVINSINMGFAESKEILRDKDLGYTIEQSGLKLANITLGSDNEIKEFMGESLGKVKGYRAWNKLSVGGEDLPFKLNSDQGRIYKIYGTFYPDNFDENLEGKPVKDDIIALKSGVNRICYQVQLENGEISPIYEFTINATKTIPEAMINYDNATLSAKELTEGDSIPVFSVDARISHAFSTNGKTNIYQYYKGEGGNWSDWANSSVEIDERVTLAAENDSYNYQSYTEEGVSVLSNKDTATNAFVVVDESGNGITAVPQIKNGENYTFENEPLIMGVATLNTYNTGEYFVEVYSKNIDLDKSTINVNGGEKLSMRDPIKPNYAGYNGASYSTDSNEVILKFTRPWDDNLQGQELNPTITVNAVGKHGDVEEITYSDLNDWRYENVGYKDIYENNNNSGINVNFNAIVKVDEGRYSKLQTIPIFSNGDYEVDVVDLYGEKYTIPLQVTSLEDGPKVKLSTLYSTVKPVTVTAQSDNYNIKFSVPESTSEFVEISNNNTNEVTAIVSQNSDIIMTWNDGTGEKTKTMYIGNIKGNQMISPAVSWSYLDEDIVDGVIYGPVTATLYDANGLTLTDSRTGEIPSCTFYPNGATSYTFTGYTDEYGKQGPEYTVSLDGITLKDYEINNDVSDTVAPSVSVLAYIMQNNTAINKHLILESYDDKTQFANPTLPPYDGYDVVNNSLEFMEKLGWASHYRMNVNVSDQNNTRLILKNEIVDTPPKYSDSSDIVDGVTLSGRTLDIYKNATFTLFAVDQFDNATKVDFIIKDLGDSPTPTIVQNVSEDLKTVKVNLIPPQDENFTNLIMTNEQAQCDSDGIYYLELTENKTEKITYSYDYYGVNQTGEETVKITAIDKGAPIKVSEKWSQNVNSEITNKDITVQLEFDKNIKKAEFETSNGYKPKIERINNRITLTYDNTAEKLNLICTGVNNESVKVEIREVNNIDKTKPIITTEVKISDDYRVADINFVSDKEVVFREGGKIGTEFTKAVYENGEYTYNFTDKAGNASVITVNVDQFPEKPLNLKFSLESSGANSVDLPQDLGTLKVGDIFYIKASSQCDVQWGGEENTTTVSDLEWTKFVIKEDTAGLQPTLIASDQYSRTRIYQFMQIDIADKKAPTIRLNNNTVNISLDIKNDEIEKILKDNIVVSDNVTDKDKINISISYEKPTNANKVKVTYYATDEAGNVGKKIGYIYFYSGNLLEISVNGDMIFNDEVIETTLGEQSFIVKSGGEAYTVSYKEGIKTTGQMKIGATKLAKGKKDEIPVVFTPSKSGYYTICINTQSRETYRFVLYVK